MTTILSFELNVRHLAAIAAVHETGSVSAAGRRLHLSQPAVTQGIAKLEQQVGTALFTRMARGMMATDAGRLLAMRVEAMFRILGPARSTSAQMRAFGALARAGSYVGAAEDTGLTEASLHRAVTDLSRMLDAPLVERRGRAVALTRRGRDVARRYWLANYELRSALEDLASLQGREIGRIVVGAMPLSRARLLPEAILSFHRANPAVDISVVEGAHADLAGPLADGQIDLLLGALRETSGWELRCETLFDDEVVVVARAHHPLACDGSPTIEALCAQPWIVSAEGTPLRALWTRMFDSLGAPVPRVAIECGSFVTIRHILLAGDHLTLLSADQVRLEVDAGLLAILPLGRSGLSRPIGITSRADWRPTSAQRQFIQHLRIAAGCG